MGSTPTRSTIRKFIRTLLEQYREKKRQEEIQRTGIEGYCICCGATCYVGKEVEHDKECIWYEEDSL